MNSQTYRPKLYTRDDTTPEYIYEKLIEYLIDTACSSDPLQRHQLCSDAIDWMCDIPDVFIMINNNELNEYRQKLNHRFSKAFYTSLEKDEWQQREPTAPKILEPSSYGLECPDINDIDCIHNIINSSSKQCNKNTNETDCNKNKQCNKNTTETDCNKNKHYVTTQGVQAIDLIDAYNLNFNLGNVIKYVSRCNYKGSKKDDLEKAMWYIDRELKTL